MTTSQAVPTRHPDRPRKAPGLGPLAALFGIGEPAEERWQELGRSLLVGDEPMDRLVEWMAAEGISRTLPYQIPPYVAVVLRDGRGHPRLG